MASSAVHRLCWKFRLSVAGSPQAKGQGCRGWRGWPPVLLGNSRAFCALRGWVEALVPPCLPAVPSPLLLLPRLRSPIDSQPKWTHNPKRSPTTQTSSQTLLSREVKQRHVISMQKFFLTATGPHGSHKRQQCLFRNSDVHTCIVTKIRN